LSEDIRNTDPQLELTPGSAQQGPSAEATVSGNETVRQQPSWHRNWPEYFKTVFVTLVVALFLKTFVVEAFRIPSGSMENTLLVGDFLLVNKLVYGIRTPRYVPLTNVAIPSISLPALKDVRRGDVVVFEFPGDRDQMQNPESVNYIKRCIGLPGDTVTILAGRVFVNGAELTLPTHAKAGSSRRFSPWRRGQRFFPPGAGFTENRYGPLVVPRRGQVIELDGWNFERWRGFIAREGHRPRLTATGAVLIDEIETSRYVVERNHLFVMGDNRDNSLDSRYWGFVPENHLIGEALVVYWSWDPTVPVLSVFDKLTSIRWERVGRLIR